VRITHRWGGLQCFTADHLPMIGVFDANRRIHGMAGFCGRGNTYTDVGAELLAARVAGVESPLEKTYGGLIDKLMEVGRASAKWGLWESSND
jgi:glycine/D-amino acid oxidase-like deaminating enzyme